MIVKGFPTIFDEAVGWANRVLDSRDLYELVDREENFTYTKSTPTEVSRKLKEFYEGSSITVLTYRSRNPWSSATAYYSSSRPFVVNLNSRKNRTVSDWGATIIHEVAHAAGFGHGNNSSKGKGNSVPYRLQVLAKQANQNREFREYI